MYSGEIRQLYVDIYFRLCYNLGSGGGKRKSAYVFPRIKYFEEVDKENLFMMNKANDDFFVIYDEKDSAQNAAMNKAEEYFRQNPGEPDVEIDGYFIVNPNCDYDFA